MTLLYVNRFFPDGDRLTLYRVSEVRLLNGVLFHARSLRYMTSVNVLVVMFSLLRFRLALIVDGSKLQGLRMGIITRHLIANLHAISVKIVVLPTRAISR